MLLCQGCITIYLKIIIIIRIYYHILQNNNNNNNHNNNDSFIVTLLRIYVTHPMFNGVCRSINLLHITKDIIYIIFVFRFSIRSLIFY